MKKELKEKWIKALLSGKYKQCKRKLSNGEAYCCIGVLCKISKIPFSIVPKGKSESRNNINLEAYSKVKELVDKHRGFTETLMNYNDSGTSFKGIAKIIEEEL